MLVRLRSSLGNIYSDWWPIHRILRPPTFLSETCCSCVIFTGQHLLGLVADTSDIATSNLPLGDLLLLCGDHSLTPCRSPYSMLVRLRSSLGNIYSDWWPIIGYCDLQPSSRDLLLLCGDRLLLADHVQYACSLNLHWATSTRTGGRTSDIAPPTFLSETCCSCVVITVCPCRSRTYAVRLRSFTGQHLLGLVADTSDIATSNLPLGDLLLLCGDPCFTLLADHRTVCLFDLYLHWATSTRTGGRYIGYCGLQPSSRRPAALVR
ncbi:hypothetical protein J6590_066135 [Homalodisca vitripennis]|nr:hypothetical protein J6590_066135 [Homalodisca vitripennis]